MLDEQWRMAPPISSAVSQLFYESKLKVADPLAFDGMWKRARQPGPTRLLGDENIVLVFTQAAAQPAHRFRGYQCEESAVLVAALVVDHVLSWEIPDIKKEVIVLTPYRAQRRRIEAELNSRNVPAATVSTVHRAQGSERRLVIFDPVCPTADFVAGGEGMRLVNVAFSRAQCRLIVMLQLGWEQHAALRFLAQRYRPIILRRYRVSELLLKKVPTLSPAKPAVHAGVASPKTRSAPMTLYEEFVAALRERVPHGVSKATAQRAAQELKDKAKFRKLTFSEIGEAIAIVVGDGCAT